MIAFLCENNKAKELSINIAPFSPLVSVYWLVTESSPLLSCDIAERLVSAVNMAGSGAVALYEGTSSNGALIQAVGELFMLGYWNKNLTDTLLGASTRRSAGASYGAYRFVCSES